MAQDGSNARTILVLGNANLDVIVGHVDHWPERGTEAFFPHADLRIGGSAANTALVLQRLGARSGLVSAHGTDFAGAAIESAFREPLDRVTAIESATGFTVGVLHPQSERTFLSSVGHLDRLDAGFFRAALADVPLTDTLIVVCGGFAMPALIDGHRRLLDWLRERGAEIAIDPGWPDGDWTDRELDLVRGWIAASDHVLINDKEAAAIAGDEELDVAAGELTGLMPDGSTLVIKRGPDGALARRHGRTIHVATSPIDPIDTVGAGDAFNAGYLHALADDLPLRACLERAVAVAGDVIAEFPRGSAPLAVDRRGETT